MTTLVGKYTLNSRIVTDWSRPTATGRPKGQHVKLACCTEVIGSCLGDPETGLPIAVRIVRTRHGFIDLRLVDQRGCVAVNPFRIGANQPCGSCFYSLRPLSPFPHHKYRFPQR